MSINQLKRENTTIIYNKRNEIGQEFEDVKNKLFHLNSYNNESAILGLNILLTKLKEENLDRTEYLKRINKYLEPELRGGSNKKNGRNRNRKTDCKRNHRRKTECKSNSRRKTNKRKSRKSRRRKTKKWNGRK